MEIFKIDGGAFEVYRERSQATVIPLRNVDPAYDPWSSYGSHAYGRRGGGGGGGYGGYEAYGFVFFNQNSFI